MTEAHLVLSPHPDDAVWSAGGRIGRWAGSGTQVTVATVFDGWPAAALPGAWRQIAEPAIRRAEDVSAVGVLGAVRVSLGLPEAALRGDRGVPRYRSPLRLFGPECQQDLALPATVADAVAGLLTPGTVVHAPLAAGGHIDHRLVRDAAALLRGLGARVRFYEDFPYRLRPEDRSGLRCAYAPVDLTAWLRAAACYRSQVTAMFGSPERLTAALLARAAEHGQDANGNGDGKYAERFWE